MTGPERGAAVALLGVLAVGMGPASSEPVRALLLGGEDGQGWAATGQASPPAWEWEREENSLALVGPEGPIWQLRYGPDLDTAYFHPLRTTDGRVLTWDRPPDHVWHHGLWFTWKFINRVNYWEIDAETERPAGRTSWSNVRVDATDETGAQVAMQLAYRPAGTDDPVLEEERSIEIGLPDAEGTYSLDWVSEFGALRRSVLDRTPLPNEPGGQPWGGYAGLSLRLTGDLSAREVLSNDGPIVDMPDDRYRGHHLALDFSGLIEGRRAGVAILDHPQNPRSPTPWYVIRSDEMNFFSPALLCFEPLTLEAGERLRLRYRVIVHHGRWDAERLRAEHARYASEAK